LVEREQLNKEEARILDLLACIIREKWNSNEFLFGTKHVCEEEQNLSYGVTDCKAVSPSEGGFLAPSQVERKGAIYPL
jgi:hypothetical protein